jgi:hypothetical protein
MQNAPLANCRDCTLRKKTPTISIEHPTDFAKLEIVSRAYFLLTQKLSNHQGERSGATLLCINLLRHLVLELQFGFNAKKTRYAARPHVGQLRVALVGHYAFQRGVSILNNNVNGRD